MPTLDEVSIDSQIPLSDEEKAASTAETEIVEEGGRGFDFSFLMTETGEGSIEDYVDHPMNFNGSKSVARILRGATGFFGSLRLAILDIILGVLEYAKESKQPTN